MGVLEQFPLLMQALKEELRGELLEQLGKGQWIDQNHPDAVMGRNKHVKACKRLMRQGSSDAHYHDGRWLIRATAMDGEILRENQHLIERGKLDSEPPPMTAPLMPPVKAEREPEDETGIYEQSWVAKLRGAR